MIKSEDVLVRDNRNLEGCTCMLTIKRDLNNTRSELFKYNLAMVIVIKRVCDSVWTIETDDYHEFDVYADELNL